MKKIRGLYRYQKGVLLFMLAMALVFAVVYSITVARVGFEYMGVILVPGQEKDGTVYSGMLQGLPARFTVGKDKTVLFQHGETIYGPYTLIEDPTAIPRGEEMGQSMIGVELRKGKELLFRGGVLETGNSRWLYREDGTLDTFGFSYVTGDGIQRDENGAIVDPAEPSASTILELIRGPVLTHKGQWLAWFGAVLLCVLNALLILFAEELFRWNLAFRIRDADRAEPSDWEMAGRYIGWTVLAMTALALFILGLQ